MNRGPLLLLALAAGGLSGCEPYDRPQRPLPESLELRTLDGATLRRADLAGKPWVINIWVPG